MSGQPSGRRDAAVQTVSRWGGLCTRNAGTRQIAGDKETQVVAATVREAALPAGVQYVVGIVGADAALRHLWTLGLLLVPCALVYAACKVMTAMHDGTRQLLESMAEVTVALKNLVMV